MSDYYFLYIATSDDNCYLFIYVGLLRDKKIRNRNYLQRKDYNILLPTTFIVTLIKRYVTIENRSNTYKYISNFIFNIK